MSGWGLAVLPLVGVVIGAALQFWLSRAADKQRQLTTLQTESYVDYLRSVAALAHLRCDDDLCEGLKSSADAKARIAVYGSAEVIQALARFEEAGPVLDNARSRNSFLDLLKAMRPKSENLSSHDIELVLFGTVSTRQGQSKSNSD